jgi:hypothetical protein
MAGTSIRSSSPGFSFHHETLLHHQVISVPWGTTSTASSAVRLGSSKSTVSFSKPKARPSKDQGHA